VLPQGSPAPRLIRECQEQVEQAKAAAEAARQMQDEAARKAADKKAADAARAPAAGSGGGKGDVAPSPTQKPATKTKP
jgi:hypothetical protein